LCFAILLISLALVLSFKAHQVKPAKMLIKIIAVVVTIASLRRLAFSISFLLFATKLSSFSPRKILSSYGAI